MDWGGCLRILFNEQPESVVRDIPPLAQLSAVIVRCLRQSAARIRLILGIW